MVAVQTSDEDSLLIAVDFGTTFTGVAYGYMHSKGFSSASVIKKWDGSNQTSDKVPTKLSYVKDKSKSRRRNQDPILKWGFCVDPEDKCIEYIKLQLGTTQNPRFLNRQQTEVELRKVGKTTKSATADFLQEILQYTERALIRHYGAKFLDKTQRRFILTVPAVWSDKEKATLKNLAVDAGFSENLQLVSEPEAAAIWTLRTLDWFLLAPGDTFVVCDAGGGTVDLISYEVVSDNPLRVREAVRGSGGFCGGSFINVEFERRLSNKMGVTKFEEFKQAYPANWHEAIKNFEEGPKRNFNPTELPEKVYSISCPGMPDSKDVNIHKGIIKVSSDELGEIFEPIVKDISDLCNNQIEDLQRGGKPPKAIVLVGGFGQSKYLQEQLASRFEAQGVQILQPEDAWSAISKGACLWASEAHTTIQSRKARYHYGIHMQRYFDPTRDSAFEKTWDDLRERWAVTNLFCSFIQNEQTISVDEPISHSLCAVFRLGEPRKSVTALLVCPRLKTPTHTTDSEMKRLCSLVSDLENVPLHYITHHTNSKGIQYVIITCNLKIQLESGGLKFWSEIDGNEYGRVTAVFD